MARGRKPAFDTVAGETNLFKITRNSIQPSANLTEEETKCFNKVISSREHSTWNDVDISTATNLARIQGYIEQAHSVIKREGMFVKYDGQTTGRHPAAAQLEKLLVTEKNLILQLGLTANQRQLNSSVQGKRSEKDLEIRRKAQLADDSGGILA